MVGNSAVGEDPAAQNLDRDLFERVGCRAEPPAGIAIEAMLRTSGMVGFVNPGSVKAGAVTEMTELGHVHRVGRRLIVGARTAKDRDDPEIGDERLGIGDAFAPGSSVTGSG
jgi:hypothetical protein